MRLSYNIIMILLLALVVVPIVNAQVDSLPTVTMNKCINITQIDSNATSETINSIYRPDGSLEFPNAVMQKNASTFYYNYCKTNLIGQYIVAGYSDSGSWPYDFTVTSTGSQSNAPVYLLGIAGFLTLCIGLYSKNEYFGLFSSFFFLILGIYTMINGFTFLATDYSRMFSVIVIGIGLIVGFSSVYEIMPESKIGSDDDE